MLALPDELAANIDVAGVRPHGEAGDQAAFDEQVRIVTQDVAIRAGPGLGFIGVDHKILWPVADLFGHERPLKPSRKAGPAATSEPGILDLVDDGVASLFQDRLRAVPSAARAGAGKAPVAAAVEILENAVLILKHRLHLARLRWCRRRAEQRIADRSGGPASGFLRGRWRRALSRRIQLSGPRTCP